MNLLLDVKGLHASYGRLQVLHGLDFNIAEGGVTCLLGANGSGKTSTLRALCGMIRVSGHAMLARRVDRRPRHRGHRAPRRRACAGRARHFHPHDAWRRISSSAPSRASSRAEIDQDIERCFTYFPAPRGAARAAGRHALRRRAADAGDQPRPDAAAEADAARRAFVRPRAAGRRGDVPHPRHSSTARRR